MHPFDIVRRPLTFLVLAELAVLGALGFIAWGVWHPGLDSARSVATTPPSGALRPAPSPGARGALNRPGPQLPGPAGAAAPTPKAPGPTPGLARNPAFLSSQLHRLNGDESALYTAEWRVVGLATTAIRNYIANVIVPLVDRSSRGA
ncbi:MAG: hypothetical protein M3024_02810 [Candidatus Dormibacteraeota bacterium]|nr:hypothetical protein [Candidatus Dormibacteraeota bacterium]